MILPDLLAQAVFFLNRWVLCIHTVECRLIADLHMEVMFLEQLPVVELGQNIVQGTEAFSCDDRKQADLMRRTSSVGNTSGPRTTSSTWRVPRSQGSSSLEDTFPRESEGAQRSNGHPRWG